MKDAAPLAIQCDHLFKSYGSHLVIKDLSLQIPKGAIYAVLGPNGAGKTTTLRMLMGLLEKDSGMIRFFGGDRSACLVSYTPDEPYLYEKLKLWEHVEVVLSVHRIKKKRQDAEVNELVRLLGLEEYMDSLVETFSRRIRGSKPSSR